MKTKIYGAIGLIAVIAIIAVALLTSHKDIQTPAQNQEPIKIGVIGVTSGFGAYYGEQERKGLELAKEEINTNGGVNGRKIELIYEDSAANPQTAVSATHKLIDINKVKFIIGDSWVSTTAAIAPVTNETGTLLISPLSLLDSLSADDLFFRTIPNTKDMAKPLAEYAYNVLGSKRIGIIQQQTAYGEEHTKDFTTFFENLGGEIVDVEKIELTQQDVKSELLKLKEKNIDTIFNLHASSASIGLVMKQAKELGINVKWLGSFGTENSPLLEQYGEIAEGIVYPYPYDPSAKSDEASSFASVFNKKYNAIPDMTAANSYDCLKLLAKAMENNRETPEQVKNFLLNVKDYSGASGIISFDKNGDSKKSIFIKTIKDKKFVRVE